VTYGLVTGLVKEPADLTIVQIDAHADLMDKLDGRSWSHGTVMRRLWEQGCKLVQVGLRSLSRSEYELATGDYRIVPYFAHQLHEKWPEVLDILHSLRGDVYLTVDVDGLDPSVIPSTGTPQPNGLSWRQTMEVFAAIGAADQCRLVGADVVELVPSPQPPGCDLTVAKLVSKLLAFWWAGR
jgi:agmatinase